MKACVFVDGENLRHSILDLFPSFDRRDYLPKTANWGAFFDFVVKTAIGNDGERVRTYWYLVDSVDPYPNTLGRSKRTDDDIAGWATRNKRILSLHPDKEVNGEHPKTERLRLLQDELFQERRHITERFQNYRVLQYGIAKKHRAIEFRRSGGISFNLISREFGQEKTVDVNLAVDMLEFSSFYDTAIIVSGDQDYVPAAQAVKNKGKRVVNVAFKARNGRLLPGGAARLNAMSDWSFEVEYAHAKKYFGIS